MLMPCLENRVVTGLTLYRLPLYGVRTYIFLVHSTIEAVLTRGLLLGGFILFPGKLRGYPPKTPLLEPALWIHEDVYNLSTGQIDVTKCDFHPP